MKNIPGRTSSAQYEIVFRANLPALGFNTYYFEVKNSGLNLIDTLMETKSSIKVTHNQACILQNEVTSEFVMENDNDQFLFL